MTKIYGRKDWDARKPTDGPGEFNTSAVVGFAIHWPGTALTALCKAGDHDAVVKQLQAEQNYHMDVKHYSDIAYNWAVDGAGNVWTLRGDTKSGANNETGPANDIYIAITCLLAPGDTPSADMIKGIQTIIALERQKYHNAKKIVPHSTLSTDGTFCPGNALRAAVSAGSLEPGVTPVATLDADDIKNVAKATADAVFKYTFADPLKNDKADTNYLTTIRTLRRQVAAIAAVNAASIAAAVVKALPAGGTLTADEVASAILTKLGELADGA